MMNNENAWNNIPLKDYERHMEHQDVAQSQLLNMLTKKYLQKHIPQNPLFLGISGGNGLEHIDNNTTKTVFGIDVNQTYLDETKKRYDPQINNLVLVNADISVSTESFLQSDFVWAALIFEYIDIKRGFEFISRNIDHPTAVIITIQHNNGNQSVSQTGVESVKAVKDIFTLVNQEALQITALEFGFKLRGLEENSLPNGKVFFTYEFIKEIITRTTK